MKSRRAENWRGGIIRTGSAGSASPGLGEDRRDGRLERGQVVDRDGSDSVEIDAEVLVNKGVAKTDDAPPGDLCVFGDEPR